MKVDDHGSMGGLQSGAAGLNVPAAAAKKSERLSGVGGQGGVAGSAEIGGNAGDEVSFSSLAGRISGEAADSVEREARIDRLAAAFEAGRYQVDADAVADAMIGEAESHGFEK